MFVCTVTSKNGALASEVGKQAMFVFLATGKATVSNIITADTHMDITSGVEWKRNLVAHGDAREEK